MALRLRAATRPWRAIPAAAEEGAMANVGIFRVEKIKSVSGMVGLAKHHAREHDPSNARKELSGYNEINPGWLVGPAADLPDTAMAVKERWRDITSDMTIRKNGVLALDLMVTIPAEEMNRKSDEQQRAFLHDGYGWIVQKHGAENVLMTTVHHDELGPHLHVMVTPVVNGKLNARELYGGSRYKMREVQDDFYEKVSKKHDLERGTLRERTRWRDSAEFARSLKEAPERFVEAIKPDIPQRELDQDHYVFQRMEERREQITQAGYDRTDENPLVSAYLAGQLDMAEKVNKELVNSREYLPQIQLRNLQQDRHRPIEREEIRNDWEKSRAERLSKSIDDPKIDPGRSGPGLGL